MNIKKWWKELHHFEKERHKQNLMAVGFLVLFIAGLMIMGG